MRVAYLINQYPKVTHTFVRTEIAAVEAAGVDVARIAIRRAETPLLDAADRREVTRTRVVLDAGITGLLAALLRTAARRPRRFARAMRMAVRMGAVCERGIARHLAYLAEACVLLGWVDGGQTQHVHATFGSNPAAVALLCRLLGGPPFSFTAHGPEEFDRAGPLSIAEKVAHATFVAVSCEAGIVQLKHACRPETWDRLHVVRCGIDDRFAGAEVEPVPVQPRIVYVGRLCAEKGPLVLVEAVAQLRAAGRPCRLVIVGDGPLRAVVEARIAALDLGALVTLTGWLDGDAVRREIVAARALVLPSFAEGLPIVLMEALALQRPVICTPVGGIAELVEPARSGWVVPAGSVDALAEAMRNALDADPVELERMGRHGAERVARQHDPVLAAGILAKLFAASAANGRCGAA